MAIALAFAFWCGIAEGMAALAATISAIGLAVLS